MTLAALTTHPTTQGADMATSTGARHVGTLDNAAPFNPFQFTPSGSHSAMPLGQNLETSEPYHLDLFLEKAEGNIKAIVVMILGLIGYGKTTLAQVLAVRYFGLSFGNQRCRVSLSNTRINEDVQEYRGFTEFLGEDMVELDRHLTNPLDMELGMSRPELRLTLRSLFEHNNTQLTTIQTFMLRVILDMLLDGETAPSLAGFNDIASRTLRTDISRRLPHPDLLVAQMEPEIRSLNPTWDNNKVSEQLRATRHEFASGYTEEDFRRAALELFMRCDNLLDGEMSGVFGGNQSLAGIYERRVVALDYSRMEDEAATMIQGLNWRVRSSALKRRDPRFRVNIELHDENYAAWEKLVYALPMYQHIKKIRQHGQMLVMNSHRLADYYSVGSAGSATREMATNMTKDVTVAFLGRQTPDAIPELRERFDLSRSVGQALLTLPQGCFCAVVGEKKPVLFRLIRTPAERKFTESDMASAAITSDYYERSLS